MFGQLDIALMHGFIEGRHEQSWVNCHRKPVSGPLPYHLIYRASGQDECGAWVRLKLDRLTTRTDLIFDRSPQNNVDKIFHMLVFWDHERRHGVVLESESRPLDAGARESWVGIQKPLNPPFAPHLDAGNDRRASRQAFENAVMVRGMGMDVLGVMREGHLCPPESPHTASAPPQHKFRKICTGPVFWSGAGRRLSALSDTKASAAASIEENLMEASQARRNASCVRIAMRMRRSQLWISEPVRAPRPAAGPSTFTSCWRNARAKWPARPSSLRVFGHRQTRSLYATPPAGSAAKCPYRFTRRRRPDRSSRALQPVN